MTVSKVSYDLFFSTKTFLVELDLVWTINLTSNNVDFYIARIYFIETK